MNFYEAAALFKEIVDNCVSLEGAHVMIAPSISPFTLVDGYEIRFSGRTFDKQTTEYLESLASAIGLSVEPKTDSVSIYKSKSVEEALQSRK